MQPSYELPRATVEETVNYMINLLDEAAATPQLPWDLGTDDTNWQGRFTKAAAMGLKCKILLFAASPLFNDNVPYCTEPPQDAVTNHQVWYGAYKPELWDQCLQACVDFFTELQSRGYYELTQATEATAKGYRDAYNKAYFTRENNKELLISTHISRFGKFNSWDEWQYIFVNSGNGTVITGGLTPTLEFMEMFPMSNGEPFQLNTATDLFYTDNDYNKPIRDPRLYETMLVNGTQFGDHAAELWIGGRDNINDTEKETGKYATDDRHPKDLRVHINDMVRRAVDAGVDVIKAVQIGSLNTAEYFGLKNQGAVAPGYKADLLILPDLKTFKPDLVIKDGKVVAENGKLLKDFAKFEKPSVRSSINVRWIEEKDFEIKGTSEFVNTIEIIPHQLVTKSSVCKAKFENGKLNSNTETDTLKILVMERHRATGNIGKGFVKGFNLKSGAIASTVAHDSHNMIIVGTNDFDMYTAAVELVKMQGGKVVVNNGEVIAKLPLPIAGLISDKDFDYVVKHCDELNSAVKELGCNLDDAFMTMSFLSLPVIPELKITDKGLFSTKKWDFVKINPEKCRLN